ncbi:MAG: T9SS type A sorting domain-containing protein [Bacteroidia bacterium]|nr:T9SS type A sorting domain-containing protein [Bacteroidia bacterium]
MKKIILLTLITIATLTNYAQTTIENFSYGTTVDTLTNPTNGGVLWKRHSGTGTPIVYNSTSLSFTGYASSGVGGSVSITNGSGSREDANRPTIIYNSGAVYTSFLLNVTASGGTTGDYIFHLFDSSGLTPGTSFRGRLFVKDGSVANTFKVGLNKGGSASTAVFTSTDYALNTPILVVIKYSFNATATDTVYAFISTSGVPSTEPTTATIANTDYTISDFTKVAGIALRQGTVGTIAATFDGFRISDSWSTSVLPVKFTSFNAIINNNQTNLTWTTASELNNKGFEIERSTDGVNFETVGFVKGNVNSNRINKYNFIDANHASAFYRLKQIDFDGKFDYSNVISVQGNDLLINITPNPFNNILEINSNGNLVNVEVLDITGKVVMSETINGSKTTLNTASLNNGVYFVRISNGESVVTKRIIKN